MREIHLDVEKVARLVEHLIEMRGYVSFTLVGGQVDRNALRQLNPDFGIGTGGNRLTAQKPTPKTPRIRNANAPVAFVPVRVRELRPR